jgi:hypothetical protein
VLTGRKPGGGTVDRQGLVGFLPPLESALVIFSV